MDQAVKKSGSQKRVLDEAEALSLDIEIRVMPQSTRTAQEAAEACECEVGQIIKSLIFERKDNEALVLLLIAGHNQADLEAIARTIGSELQRADPRKVRAETGFAIGGVAPIGHKCPMPVYMDPALLDYDLVWAAAGSPQAVFSVEPHALQKAVNAAVLPA
jgi:prolyl-tRNA editing enzyme YbaK/EbsC (Cys-tRNA(Pro) deacylase)